MPNKALELRAAAVIASILDACFICRDVGGRQIRDFDLLFRDGHVEPLEITEASIPAIRHTAGRLRSTDRVAPTLKRDWHLDVPNRQTNADGAETAYDLDRLFREGEPLLASLEAIGRTSFDIGKERFEAVRAGPPLRDLYERLLALGVTIGLSHEPHHGEHSRIIVGMTYSSTGYGQSLSEIVLGQAMDNGNRSKLGEPAAASARHLGVVLEPSVGRAYHGLRTQQPGEAPDALPEPITTVWALADTCVAWVAPPGEWTVKPIADQAVFDHPERWECTNGQR